MALVPEPGRQRFSAIFLAGAGGAYLSGGFGLWEFAFCALITLLAVRGLASYRTLAAGWLAHSVWDYLHHLYGNPIIPFAPASSFGCMLCDPVLALWYLLGAPSLRPAGARLARGARGLPFRTQPVSRSEPAIRTMSPGTNDVAALRRLRFASIVEASTLLALLLVAVPLKYAFGLALATRILGAIHGAAFIFYAWALSAAVGGGGSWSLREVTRLTLGAFIPFGGFANGPLLRRKERGAAAAHCR